MTRKNAKKNYDHYRQVGKDDVAEDILEKYPGIEEDEGHKCDECGGEFGTEKGLKIHKSQKHG